MFVFVTEHVLVCLSLWRLDIWQLNLATKAFPSFWFYFCVIFRSTGREHQQSSWCRLPDGDGACWMTRSPFCRVAVFGEGWPFKKKKQPAVQRRARVNPSVVSFHVEVMLSKSFGTKLPGWRRDGWMSRVITEYPCSWLNQTSWLLEIKLLRLHVGSWIKVEGPPLSSVGVKAGIFVNLKKTDIVRSQQSTLLTEREKRMKILTCNITAENLHHLLKSTDQ